MKPIKVMVTVKTEKYSYSVIEDYTEYAEDLIDCNNEFTSTGVKMTEDNIEDYFKEGTFKDSEIEVLNGDHFLFGFVESLAQSDSCPEFIRNRNEEMTFIVERME